MNKKKILSLALVIALLAIMVGSSLAYFTAQDEVTNVFTVGSVKVEIYENGEATEDIEKDFGPLIPVVNTANPSADPSYQAKVVNVHNTGLNAAYVRTHIAVPTKLVNYLELDVAGTGWKYKGSSTASDGVVEYTVYTYDYTEKLEPNKSTTELLRGAYLDSDVDLLENEDGNLEFIRRNLSTGEVSHESGFVAHVKGDDGKYTPEQVNILVATQAIQADGFEGYADALAAGFPAANPWVTVTPNP